MREKIDLADLVAMDVGEIIEGMTSKQLSVLEIFGAKRLKREMKLIGLVCGFFLQKINNHVLRSWARLSDAQRYAANRRDFEINVSREYTLELLSKWAPVEVYSDLPLREENNILIIGFNHPTLGEIFRLLGVVFEKYRKDTVLFPVNLPWFEAIVPYSKYLELMGVKIVPLITPSTSQKIKRIIKDAESEKALTNLTVRFARNYAKSCREMLELGGGIVPVAPSATRQETIFASEEAFLGNTRLNPVISLLITSLSTKNKPARCGCLPILVVPPPRCNRRLNLLRTYRFYPCEHFDSAKIKAIRNESKNIKGFDYNFLCQIANMAEKVGLSGLVYPL